MHFTIDNMEIYRVHNLCMCSTRRVAYWTQTFITQPQCWGAHYIDNFAYISHKIEMHIVIFHGSRSDHIPAAYMRILALLSWIWVWCMWSRLNNPKTACYGTARARYVTYKTLCQTTRTRSMSASAKTYNHNQFQVAQNIEILLICIFSKN